MLTNLKQQVSLLPLHLKNDSSTWFIISSKKISRTFILLKYQVTKKTYTKTWLKINYYLF